MRVVGLDLSLTATGVAVVDGNCLYPEHYTVSITTREKGYPRLRYILNEIRAIVLDRTKVDLVVVEGPSYGSTGRSFHQIAGLWWLITYVLTVNSQPFAVVPPTSAKLYFAGSGRANKDDMVREATRRFDWFNGDNNQADALALCAMGWDWLGLPITKVPEKNRKALERIEWPIEVKKCLQ
jgi:Holliday junction resolvasome RuvABC endonuclease subunit